MTENGDLNYEYLRLLLNWLDVNLETLLRRWQLSGQKMEDRFRGLYVSNEEAHALIQQGAANHWGNQVMLSPEEQSNFEKAQLEVLDAIKIFEGRMEQEGFIPRLLLLADIFDLSEFEWWAFVICLAPAIDLRYEKIYGFLQDDVTAVQARVNLILTLLLPQGLSHLDFLHYFDSQSALRRYRLILPVENDSQKTKHGLHQAFYVAPAVLAWVLGQYIPENAELTLLDEESNPEEDARIFEKENLPSRDVLEQLHPIISLYGDDILQQEILVRSLAAALERPLLRVTLTSETTIETALDLMKTCTRDARMIHALLYVQGGDLLIDREGCWLNQAFEVFALLDDCMVISSTQPFKFSETLDKKDYPLMRIFVDGLTSMERREIWVEMISGVGESIPDADLTILAGQFNLTTSEVVTAASMAISQALQYKRPLQTSDLFEAARFHSGRHLGELTQKIEPRYEWNDLVLPETPMSMLKELVSMVKARTKVLEEWGLGRKLTASAGVSALFTGQSGTGKTLAAQIIAHELGIDLYRIDLSTIVSKYIGETEKNLERIFNEAQTSNAILFFDEADAIFGKRSEVKDAHDRYANIEVGYLLQRMEAYDGLAILATNLRANLDEAFTRRLQFIVNFPFPDQDYRLKIWQVLIPPSLPKAGDLDLELMANRYKLAGGNIRNIIVSAAYLAANDGGVLTMKHLMHGARREFQKMGRLINEADFIQ